MRAARRFNGLTLAAALALGAGCEATAPPVPPVVATAPAPAPDPVKARLEDLEAFERGFFDMDRSYSSERRAEAARRLKELKAAAGATSDTRFVLELARIAALADNGHSGIFYRGRTPGFRRVALRLAPFAGEFIVVKAAPGHASVVGGRLISIDDTPVARLREAARTLVGGVPSRRDIIAPLFLESPGQLHALGLARDPERATYRFQMRSGETRAVDLPAVNPGGSGLEVAMALLSPENAPSGWSTLLAPEAAPWALRDIRAALRWRDLPELNAIHVQLRANLNAERPIGEFLDECERERRRAGRSHVILDMRMNGGGDLTTTREWMRALPSQLPADGRIVLLTSPWTFSAAISSTGYVKQAGGSRVTLVGEAPGDRLDFFAEGRPIRLPNSGAMVLMATERHDYANGCRAYTDCHPEVVRHPIAVRSLEPEVRAPWTIEAYIAGRDPGLEAAERILRK